MTDQFKTEVKNRMQKAYEVTRQDLGSIRTGRATPALVDHLIITAYNQTTKLKLTELATVTATDIHTLLIHPFDPTTIEDIVKCIQEANIGLNPVREGEIIRITIPSLSQERRQEYVKLARAKLEAGKVMIRQIRQEEMIKLKRTYEAKEMIEDEKKRQEKLIQEATDEIVIDLEQLGRSKEKELLQI